MSDRFGGVPTALPIEFSRDAVVVNEEVKYNVPIVPEDPHHFSRTIDVRKGATLKGPIFGLKVKLGPDSVIGEWVFGEESITLADTAKVEGTVVSSSLVEIQDECEIGSKDHTGNIIARTVKVGSKCKIFGNIIAGDSLEIGGECTITGIVFCLGKEMKMGQGVVCRDVFCNGEGKFMPGLEVKDDVIWALGAISPAGGSDKNSLLSNMLIGGEKPRALNLRGKESTLREINMNYDKVSLCDPSSLPVKAEVLKQVKDALRR